ncbi:MAG TPA: ABC transporter permease [Bacteroidales bacterium]|nr:ABC transporter permease [Bacteroidales bacterium]
MILALKLAYRNLIGAGLRTWLNVIILSFSFVLIIFMKGIISGWDQQAKTDMKNMEIGGGQYWHELYDPFDPFTLNNSHTPVPPEVLEEINAGDMVPVLIAPGAIYPQGRLQSVVIKGIDPGQHLFALPTQSLDTVYDAIPAMIGAMMAKSLKASKGDVMTLRWRDVNGTFDAREIVIAEIFSSNVPQIETGQIYVPLETLRNMTLMPDEATILTFRDSKKIRPELQNWTLKTTTELTASIDSLIKTKTAGQTVLFLILLLLALLAVFDTQVLSIFRRQKEIGTYIALGYTRGQVVGLFTIEGTMHAILAAILSLVYGLPFLAWMAKSGLRMPIDTSEFGMAIAQTLYPVYPAGLVIMTIISVTTATAVVSYWPSRRISRMNPTDALRGKLQ